ncbi:HdeD family acid-resistance protein [Pseudonocardia hispaniensis]|uniref:HdeD family acid-resistance protein n=1 Tax=Pseudonocardia hispaniensis TaxID=904933 RepID=A0ABW1J8S6_9PSEU
MDITSSQARGALTTLWWLILLRGVLAVAFGLFALFAPGTALLALVIVFGAYAVVDGITAIVLGVRHRTVEQHWGWQVVQGVVSLAAGVIALLWPGVTALAILLIIAFWSIVHGIAQVVEAFAARKRGSDVWGWLLTSGIIGVLFGVLLLALPGAGLLALLWMVGVFAVVFGVLVIMAAIRVRREVRAAAG